MQQASKQVVQNKQLLFNVASKGFASQNTFLGSINPDLNHNLRVMSTPEWPVPYYQRAFRHPASLEKREGNLNHFDLASYKTQFRDSAIFSKAYVDDMLDCLSVSFEQNVRLLNEHDLGDCLKE
ncbi:hypothetical protein FGO68_gene9451 [Halteria grandinella]|uniref:Uncharacterized protein n=1 Tax=Halteria grandinella TaxID=5974 RepID=A0A8J8NVE6_HALGN|nr:hypothetical protein FGO68_gene9451 [Halteria grandinella]